MIDVCSEDDLLKLKECSAMARAKQVKFHKSNVFATLECPEPETCSQMSSQTLPRSYFGHSSENTNNPDYAYAYCEPNLLKHNQFAHPYPHEGRDKKISVSVSSNALSKPQSSTSLRALLIKNFRKSSIGNGGNGGSGDFVSSRTNFPVRTVTTDASSFTSRLGAKENIYEDVNVGVIANTPHSGIPRFKLEAPKSVRTHRSIESFIDSSIEEEFRLVQSQHERIMAELNLSVEALLMPTKDETEHILSKIRINTLRDITDHTYDEPVNNRFLTIKSVLQAHQPHHSDTSKICKHGLSTSCGFGLNELENSRPSQFVFPPPPLISQNVLSSEIDKNTLPTSTFSSCSTLTPTTSVSTTNALGSCETSCCFYDTDPIKSDVMACNICCYQQTLSRPPKTQIESISDKVKFINSTSKFKLTGLSHTCQQ